MARLGVLERPVQKRQSQFGPWFQPITRSVQTVFVARTRVYALELTVVALRQFAITDTSEQ